MMVNKRPEGDIWHLVDTDPQSQNYGRRYRFDFTYIKSKAIQSIVKDYIWQNHRTKNKALSKLYRDLSRLKYFNDYAESHEIRTLRTLTNADIDGFTSYLHTTVTFRKKTPLAYQSQKNLLDTLKAIIHWGQRHQPAMVPDREIFTGNEYTGINRKLSIDYIPDDIITQINEALKEEENPCLKYGMIILELTGMRIGDLLKLKTDCIHPHPISGFTITWFDHKNRKLRKPMPVRSECVSAVEKLNEATSPLREEADEKDRDILLIHRVSKGESTGKVMPLSKGTIGNWMNAFIRRNDIRDADGEWYNLTAHQFRRTLGTDMLSKGTNVNVIQQVLGHSDPSTTTRFYADIKDRDRAKVFRDIGIIGNIENLGLSAFDTPDEAQWFQDNKDTSARLCDGYCTKPIENGQPCDRLLKRLKCYTCSRYITTPEYLEAHKQHLAGLERQIKDGVIYGEHYIRHFLPTIEVLKVIIERLEAMQHGRE